MIGRALKLAAMLVALPAALAAVEVHIQFAALERLLTEQVFTNEGRRYVRGDKTNKCNFAYLEKPEVRGEGGRLRMRARFTGRTALNVAGQCVGLGDAFEVTVTALPLYQDGAIGLQDVKVTSERKGGYYIRKVCAALQASLAKGFTYPLAAAMQRALEDPATLPAYKREVRKFTVPEIRVTSDALVLQVEFELTVK
jgi:hypothetical protein